MRFFLSMICLFILNSSLKAEEDFDSYFEKVQTATTFLEKQVKANP
ncbi:MAG: hypothetical protein K940chlam1_00959, partial [Candidatus Anoxychlamydiales bacterium]|nr:hypothetical protein [Candidatus Anoxychlamydiales bacterium]